jgi:hypothetical protein
MARIEAWEWDGQLFRTEAEALRVAKKTRLAQVTASVTPKFSARGDNPIKTFDFDKLIDNAEEVIGILSATSLEDRWLQ